MEVLRRIFAGAFGGAIGGALVGLCEAAVIAFGGGAEEYWAFLFGALSYGLIGGAGGAGYGLLSRTLPFGKTPELAFGTAAGAIAAGLGVVVARFRIIRDVFSENLRLATPEGIAVYAGLLIGGLACFFLLRRIFARAADRRGFALVGPAWVTALLVVGWTTAVILGAFAGGDAVPSKTPTSATGPNVVLIVADTLRADRLGAYGRKDGLTPNIDSLAADGVVFENAFGQSSWTRPSIATILTGLYAASHRVMHKTDLLPEDVLTLAEIMKQGGYRTSGFVTNINVAPSFGFDQGFDLYRYLSPSFFFGATDSGAKLSLYSGMRLVRERFLSTTKRVYNYYQDAETVNAATLPWLDDNAREPFFSLIHYMDPHDPYFTVPYDGNGVARVDTPNPDPSRAEELAALYDTNVAYLDRFIGDLMQVLKAAKAYDNTIIVFTADHGEEFQEHGGWWHGTTLFDEQIHVPLVIKLDNGRHKGRTVSDLAGLVDVAPTLVAAVGLASPGTFQGRDLFGGTSAPEMLYAEEDHEGNVLESVRGHTWKLIVANPGNPRRLTPTSLFNVADDPGESRNLAAIEPRRVDELKEKMAALREFAASRAVAGSSGEIDEATRQKLESLGYVGE